jgi:hypothetical protein
MSGHCRSCAGHPLSPSPGSTRSHQTLPPLASCPHRLDKHNTQGHNVWGGGIFKQHLQVGITLTWSKENNRKCWMSETARKSESYRVRVTELQSESYRVRNWDLQSERVRVTELQSDSYRVKEWEFQSDRVRVTEWKRGEWKSERDES